MFYFLDFLKQCTELFAAIDTQNSGKIDHTVCEAISIQLAESIKSSTDAPTAFVAYIWFFQNVE